VRALEHLARHGRQIAKPQEWLFTIARCAYVDHVRLRLARPTVRLESSDASRDPAVGPDALCERQEALRRLAEAIEDLDPRSRGLLIGFHLAGERYDYLATRWGFTRTAARVRVHRARNKLRRRLG
jgi:RNA polymerase sigma factor (sigma-70 family)